MALASAGVTMLTHVKNRDPLTWPERLANATVSCVAYLGQLFVPVGLSTFYSYPEGGWPAWQVISSGALLLTITAAAVVGRRTYPYFFVGWFWYLGMLVPVLELIRVGWHARADRYTYLSQIGLDIALVWVAMRWGAPWPARRWVFCIGSALVLTALVAGSWRQTGYWRDDKTLWEHAVACDQKNVTAHRNLAVALEEAHENGAEAQFRLAVELGPNERNIYNTVRATAYNSLGNIAKKKGDLASAAADYQRALESDSSVGAAQMNMAVLLAETGDFDRSLIHFQKSFELAPNDTRIVQYLAKALAEQSKTDEAVANYRKALEALAHAPASPDLALIHMRLALLLAERNEVDDAIAHLRHAVEIEPDAASCYSQIAQLLRKQGKTDEAAHFDRQAKQASRRILEKKRLNSAAVAPNRAGLVGVERAGAHAVPKSLMSGRLRRPRRGNELLRPSAAT